MPLLPGLKSIHFSLRPSPPQAEPGSPDRGAESTGVSAHWEEGAASSQTQAGRMSGPHRMSPLAQPQPGAVCGVKKCWPVRSSPVSPS